MALLVIPEFRLKQIVDAILLFIRNDYVANGDNCHLATLLKGIKVGKYDLYEQAIEIFVNRGRGHPKELQCHSFFNLERAAIPTIHIVLPDDATGPNGIGVDENFVDPIWDPISKTNRPVYQRSFDSRLNLIITSENSFEVITIYRILQSMLITVFNDIQMQGLQNPKLSGGDLQINPDLVPAHIFFRAINLDFFYDTPAPTVFTNETFSDLIAQGIAISTELTEESSSLI